jgi:hypothetical protein
MNNNKYINMKKFNGFEAYLILEGLKEVSVSMKEGIEKTLAEGKMPLMTTGYVDMVIKDAVEKVNSLTVKQK